MRGDGRTFQRGNRWWIAFYVHGVEVREPGGKTEREARKKLKGRIKESCSSDYVGPQAEKLRVNDLLDTLVIHLENKGVKSRSHLSHIKPIRRHFGFDRAMALDGDRIERFIAEQRKEGKAPGKKGKAPATINREITVLKQAYNLARKHNKIPRVPYFPTLNAYNVRKGFFEKEQVVTLLKHLPDHLGDLSTFAYYTAWRKGEIVKLTWDMVDRKAGEIRLPTSKNGDPRSLALEGPVQDLIEKRWAARHVRKQGHPAAISQLVFHRNGKKIGDIRKAWKTACAKAELPGKLFHDLRRTGVRNMIRAGVSQVVAMSISGHKTVSMFHRYNITSSSDQRRALKDVSRHLGELG